MDLERMLFKCKRDQWQPQDLDWSQPPRNLSRDDEIAIVQYFTNMAGIELLAGALFKEQRDRATDPVLREIFETFVKDEERHSVVALRLADHYNVHRYQDYETDPALERFAPHFVNAIRFLSAEVANIYITTGELILDVALLRSLNDYVDDAMSHQAMELINRDESRHIAIDFHMIEYYSSEEYDAIQATLPARKLRTRIQAWWALGNMFYYAAPFFRRVFFRPMDLLDPGGKRMREAFKRIQLVGAKPRVARRPFNRFLLTMQGLYRNRWTRPTLGWLGTRIMGLRPEVMGQLYTNEEGRRAQVMSFDAMAREALAAKLA